jgi:elongation factor 1-gamma
VVAAKKEKKEKEPKPKAESKKAEPKKEAPKKEAAVVDAEADGLDMMEEKKKDPLDLLPKGSFDLEEWKRFYSNNDEEASCAWFWQHFDPQHYSIWRGEYRSGQQLLSITILANFFY